MHRTHETSSAARISRFSALSLLLVLALIPIGKVSAAIINVTLEGNGSGLVSCGYYGYSILCSMPPELGGNVCSATIPIKDNSSGPIPIILWGTPSNSYVAGWSGCPNLSISSDSSLAECMISTGGTYNMTVTFSSYIVTPSAGANGSINPNTPQMNAPGGVDSFTVTPNTGYYIASVTGCGGTLSGNTYTTGPITSSCTVTATFGQDFTVTPSAGANGSISPDTPQYVAPNGTTSFTVTPNTGYGASVSGCGGTLSGNTYTTGPITSDCTVSATFTALPTYTITSSAGPNGSVSPTSATIYSGYNFTLTITPASGYQLTKLTDNGTDVTSDANLGQGAYTYTITGVTSNQTIQATFGPGTPGNSQGPALSILAAVFTVGAALGVILWVRRKVNA